MKKPTEGRHPIDQREAAGPEKVAAFMRLGKSPRETYHVSRDAPSSDRLVQFMRIARGHTT